MDDIIKKIFNNIYKNMGIGYTENVYQNCICHELQKNNIIYQKEVIINFKYDNVAVGWGRLDLVFTYENKKVIIELKHITRLTKKEKNQVERY